MKEKILTLIGALMGGVIFLGAFIWIVKHIRIVVAGLYPNLKYIDEDAIVASIEKLRETKRYATLLKAAERVDKHLTLDWLNDDTYVSLVDEQYEGKSELRDRVIALIEALPEKEGKKCQKKST